MKSQLRTAPQPQTSQPVLDGPEAGTFGNAALCELLRQGGRPVPGDVLAQARASWGGGVDEARVHTGGAAAEAAEALGVEAFAYGTDLFFGAGAYRPDDPHGRFVLLHELAHAAGTGAATAPPSTLDLARDAGAEAAADAAAGAALSGRPHRVGSARVGLHAFGATAGRDEDGERDAEAICHENQTVDAALAAGLSEEEASMLYSGNWQRDMNQLILASTADFAAPLYELLDIAHFKHFGFGLPSATELGGYDPVEHIDNPGGLGVGDAVMGREATVGQGETLAEGDVRYGEDAWAVDASGMPAYVLASRTALLERLHEAVQVGGGLDDDGGRGLRLAGEALHTVQDFFAHSNFCEIALNLWVGGGNLDTQVHFAGETENARTEDGSREILATGTFLTGDTVHSIKEKALALLNDLDPFAEKASEPSPWTVAVIDWMQSNQDWLPGTDRHLAAVGDVLRGAVPGVQAACGAAGMGQQAVAGVYQGASAGLSLMGCFPNPATQQLSQGLAASAAQARSDAALADEVAVRYAEVADGLEQQGGVAALYVLAYETFEPLTRLSTWLRGLPVVGPALHAEARRTEERLRTVARARLSLVWDEVCKVASDRILELVEGAVGDTELEASETGAPWSAPTHTDIAKDFDGDNHGEGGEDSHAGAWLAPWADDLARLASDELMVQLVACWDGADGSTLEPIVERFFAHPADNRAEWEPVLMARLASDPELAAELEERL